MSNDRNTNTFWKNVATGVGVAAAGAALAYLVSELFTEEANSSEERTGERRRRRTQHGDTSQLRKNIIDKLNSGTYECNICLDEIARNDQIVSCKNCYTINHLRCMKKHYNSSGGSGRTPCPACRNGITYELQYYCFCGSNLNPKPIEGVTPHSCRSKCHNKVNCRLLCHPGPCSGN